MYQFPGPPRVAQVSPSVTIPWDVKCIRSDRAAKVMQNGREAESEEEDGAFQSPEWEGDPEGASPKLRRSSRKRKSTAGDRSMTRESSSKKKKSSPKTDKMPKVPRSPQGATAQPQAGQSQTQQQSFEALLLAMEGRLTSKLERASEAARDAANQAKLNSESLDQLESRVDANEAVLMEALRESEARIMAKVQVQVEKIVQGKVKEMVNKQLSDAGFDPDLTAADLSVRSSAVKSKSYLQVAAAPPVMQDVTQSVIRTKVDRQEERFWEGRRALRLWPLETGDREGLRKYLLNKLALGPRFVDEEMGEVEIRRAREPKNKKQDEYIVLFESKHIRDAVKAAAPSLATFKDEAGMRLHVPDHLQKQFKTLMSLSYELKKKTPGLKRNIKFDEESLGMFMDIQLETAGQWKRIDPREAAEAVKGRSKEARGMAAGEIKDLLGSEEED